MSGKKVNKKLFTVGIEEEFQIVDPKSRELRSHIQQIINKSHTPHLSEQLKPEMHQSVVEIGTQVCSDIKEARKELYELRTDLARAAKDGGMRI
ncbi:MAG: carboxylate-amine ligase, partial [Calditrichae bacterium]|nr:carboxylate-amine ligase [Calditrichia bacterium]